MVDAELPIVTITGVSGYIGAHVCLRYLQDGGFKVRGTVRDKTNPEKLAQLQLAFGAHFDKLELVNADLMNEQSLIDAIAGSTYVVHVASPFFFGGTEDEVIKPAVQGTLAALKACQVAKVKRCVVTSSGLSILMVGEASRPASGLFNESIWSDPDRPEGVDTYSKSKVLAERAAWKFVEDLPADEKFELVTVLPAFVMGPPLMNGSGTSIGFLQALMTGKMPTISSDCAPHCDVRQVGEAHLLAVKNSAAAGRRFLIVDGTPSMQDRAAPIIAKYKAQGWPITDQMQAVDPAKYVPKFDNSASKELGVGEYLSLEQTMHDMAEKLIELNMVAKPAQ